MQAVNCIIDRLTDQLTQRGVLVGGVAVQEVTST